MNKWWYLLGGSFAVAFLAVVVSGPKVAENLRPLKNDRMQEGFDVFTDKDTGKIYGYIAGAGGERRFVQMDKNSENKVRKERIEAEAKAAKEAAKLARERAVKWRTRERKMLYRLSITAPSTLITNDSGEPNCISSERESELISLVTGKDNEVRLRFKDSDDFWLRDFLIPLSQKKAQDFKTTAIDAFYKDDCGNTNQFVFHGRLDNFSPPDYTWVEDGKLLFSGVKITKPESTISN